MADGQMVAQSSNRQQNIGDGVSLRSRWEDTNYSLRYLDTHGLRVHQNICWLVQSHVCVYTQMLNRTYTYIYHIFHAQVNNIGQVSRGPSILYLNQSRLSRFGQHGAGRALQIL